MTENQKINLKVRLLQLRGNYITIGMVVCMLLIILAMVCMQSQFVHTNASILLFPMAGAGLALLFCLYVFLDYRIKFSKLEKFGHVEYERILTILELEAGFE